LDVEAAGSEEFVHAEFVGGLFRGEGAELRSLGGVIGEEVSDFIALDAYMGSHPGEAGGDYIE
jgi:hypothetical protein